MARKRLPMPALYLLLAALALLLTACAADPQAFLLSPERLAASDESAEIAAFLADNYGVALDQGATQEEFAAALDAVAGPVEESPVPPEVDAEGLSGVEAALTILYRANLDEVAASYSPEQAARTLAGWTGLPADLAPEARARLAAAVDAGLLDARWRSADLAAPASPALLTDLAGKLLAVNGGYKHALGSSEDPDIFNKLLYAYNSFDQVLMPDLQAQVDNLIRTGVITGYNIKRESLQSNFDPARAIVYGHANIEHVRQLIVLLRREGLEADVLLEPKTSAYLYLAEWGEPTVSPGYQVVPLEDGNYIAYAKEFDVALEFSDPADRTRFDAVIKAFAKKDAPDEPGLLFGSWFQPLYSLQEGLDGYFPAVNNVLDGGDFYIQSFSLPEDSAEIAAAFDAVYPEGEVIVEDLWVNEAFRNYLMGEPL